MNDTVLVMALFAGVAAGIASWIGTKLGRICGHIEAVGAMRYPDSPLMAEAKWKVNKTLRLCRLSELD